MKIWMMGIKYKFAAVTTQVGLPLDKAQWVKQGNDCLPFGFFYS